MKFDPNYQYTYFKSPVYCQVDKSCNPADEIWILTDGCLDAPEAIPTGGLTGRCKKGYTTQYKWYEPREQKSKEELIELDELAEKLIQELLADLED